MELFSKHTSMQLLESSIRKPSPQVLTGAFGSMVGDTFPPFVEKTSASGDGWIQRYDPIVFWHPFGHDSSISGFSHSLISKIEIGIGISDNKNIILIGIPELPEWILCWRMPCAFVFTFSNETIRFDWAMTKGHIYRNQREYESQNRQPNEWK